MIYQRDGNGGYRKVSRLYVGVVISIFALLFTMMGVLASTAMDYGALNNKVENLEYQYYETIPKHEDRIGDNEKNVQVLITEISHLVKTVDRLVDKMD